MVPVKRTPSNPITPHGAYYFLSGRKPTMSYLSPDGTSVFYLMGGMAIPDQVNAPESVRLKEMSGLIPPWQPIEQKGATQDGVTFIDALYDPIDGDMTVEVCGKTPERTAQVVRDWIAAWDAKKPGELSFFDQYAGRWWVAVRWTRNPVDKIRGSQSNRQTFSWPFKAHDAFWRSYDNTDSFEFLYEDFVETFDIDYPDDLGPNWPLDYSGSGTGHLFVDDGQAKWQDDPDSLFFTGTRRVVNGPYTPPSATAGPSALPATLPFILGYGFTDDGFTDGDGQSVATLFGSSPEYTAGAGAANDIWLRMGSDGVGAWDGNGVRGRIGWGYVQISVFKNFVETELKHEFELWPPVSGETVTFSVPAGSRTFTLTRTNILGTQTVISATDSAAVSNMGASYRGVGFGMQAGASVITQATPGAIRSITVNGTLLDAFSINYALDLGMSWPQHYTQTGDAGDAFCHADTGCARWVDNSGTDTQGVVAGPYDDGVFSETETDNQVVTMEYGTFQEWSLPRGAGNDLWARMGRDGSGNWDGNGIRVRVENNIVKLSRYNGFGQTVMAQKIILIPPLPGEKFKIVCGYQDEPRLFKVFRGSSNILSHKEVGTGSALGPAYRGIGFGMQAGAALITQATPSNVRRVAGGDHSEVSQSGILRRINVGDQVMWDRYTLHGPGTFHISAGPESADMVKYGPLLPGQTVQLRTDPRKRGVVDLTSVPPSPQELNVWQSALDDLLSFAAGNNASPLIEEVKSLFGIMPPQGNMYSLLKGRFAAGIPPRPAAGPMRSYSVSVEVVGGSADTRIIAAGTPLRRWPL